MRYHTWHLYLYRYHCIQSTRDIYICIDITAYSRHVTPIFVSISLHTVDTWHLYLYRYHCIQSTRDLYLYRYNCMQWTRDIYIYIDITAYSRHVTSLFISISLHTVDTWHLYLYRYHCIQWTRDISIYIHKVLICAFLYLQVSLKTWNRRRNLLPKQLTSSVVSNTAVYPVLTAVRLLL
jgi:hypothetical protein